MGLLDGHNPYPAIPAQAGTRSRPGLASITGLALSALWLFGFGSIVGLSAGVYAWLHCEPGRWPRKVAAVAIGLSLVGIVAAAWIGLSS